MTRIDFYLQQIPAIVTLETWVCRLVDKAFSQSHQVYVLTPDQETATHLDHLLWTFSPGSFVPHALWGSAFVPDDALPRPSLGSSAFVPDDALPRHPWARQINRSPPHRC